jgi:hypothetical protein
MCRPAGGRMRPPGPGRMRPGLHSLEDNRLAEVRAVDLVEEAARPADACKRWPWSRPLELELVIGGVALAEADRTWAADLAPADEQQTAIPG